MLKIKDDVDLKELEKYGYEYESILEVYYKMIIPHKWKTILFNTVPQAITITINKEREIITKRMKHWLDWNECRTDKKDIKDLLKAGLVEKVEK